MTRLDLLIVLLCGIGVGALYVLFWTPPVAAAWVEVRAPEQGPRRYPLDTAQTVHVRGRLGDSEIRIEQGRVRFVHGPCRNKVCIHSGWLAHDGDAAACLPNRVSIRLLGGAEASFDAIAH